MKKVVPILMLLAIFGWSKSIAQTAYIPNYGSNNVSVINVSTNFPITTIPVGSHPIGVSVNPCGNKVYITNYGGNTVSIINTATNRSEEHTSELQSLRH